MSRAKPASTRSASGRPREAATGADSAARPWQIVAGRTVYDNKWIRVREYDAVAPTGAPALYGLVHMKNLAVGVLPVDDEGFTWLVGQQRFAFGRYSWELPQGGGNPEAPAIETAIRELGEETGMKAANYFPLFSDVHLSNSVTDETACAFIAWGLSPDETFKPDDVEALSLRRIPFHDAVRLAAEGQMPDVFSLVMLLKADHLARTGRLPPDLARLMAPG